MNDIKEIDKTQNISQKESGSLQAEDYSVADSAPPALGRGVNLNTRKIIGAFAFKSEYCDKNKHITPIMSSDAAFSWATERKEIRDKLNCDINVSASYGIVEVGGGGTYNTVNVNTGLTKTMIAMAVIKVQEETIQPESSDWVIPVAVSTLSKDINKYYKQYGNGYIKSVTLGARCIGNVTMEFNSTSAMEKFSQHLKLSASQGVASAELQQKFEKDHSVTDEKVTISLSFQQQGGAYLSAVDDMVKKMTDNGAVKTSSNEVSIEGVLMKDSVAWFNKIQTAVMEACGKLGPGLEKNPQNSIPLDWRTAEYDPEIFSDGVNNTLPPSFIDEVNKYQTIVFGKMNVMLGLYALTNMRYLGSDINLMPGVNNIKQLQSREHVNQLQATLYKNILDILATRDETEALNKFNDLKNGVETGKGRYGPDLMIGNNALKVALEHIDKIRTNCWIYCSGPTDAGAVKGKAMSLITNLSTDVAETIKPSEGKRWMNLSLSEASAKIASSKGLWIGNGSENTRARFQAPWNFSKEAGTVTPIYPGYTGNLVATNNGFVASLDQTVSVPAGDYTGETILCANTDSILKMTKQGLKCFTYTDDNNVHEWEHLWPGKKLPECPKVEQKGDCCNWYTELGDEFYLDWTFNNDTQTTHDVTPGALRNSNNLGMQLQSDAVWATQITNMHTFATKSPDLSENPIVAGAQIAAGSLLSPLLSPSPAKFMQIGEKREPKDVYLLKNKTPPKTTNTHRFLKLSDIWDDTGRLLVNQSD